MTPEDFAFPKQRYSELQVLWQVPVKVTVASAVLRIGASSFAQTQPSNAVRLLFEPPIELSAQLATVVAIVV